MEKQIFWKNFFYLHQVYLQRSREDISQLTQCVLSNRLKRYILNGRYYKCYINILLTKLSNSMYAVQFKHRHKAFRLCLLESKPKFDMFLNAEHCPDNNFRHYVQKPIVSFYCPPTTFKECMAERMELDAKQYGIISATISTVGAEIVR